MINEEFQAKLEWHQDAIQFQGTKPNPPLSELIIIITVVVFAQCDATDGKVTVTKTLVSGIWWDFNPTAAESLPTTMTHDEHVIE